MPERAFHIGLIVPSSNTVMETDFHRRFSRPAVVTTTRIFLEDVTREAETRMNEVELPQAARLIRTVAPDVVVFGCTSAGSLGGIGHDAAIGRSIELAVGARAVTVIGSVVAWLERLQPKRVAVFTPYRDDMTQSVADCVIEAGFEVVKAAGMGIVDNREIGRVTPSEIVQFVERGFQRADAVFLSCTNWRAIETIHTLEQRLGAPVFTSNQACIDAVASTMKATMNAVEECPA
jgi:maleate isomerase